MTAYSNFYETTLNSEDFNKFTVDQLIREMNALRFESDTEGASFFAEMLEQKGYSEPSFQQLKNEMEQQRIDIINACLGKI